MLGMRKEEIIKKLIVQMPVKFVVDEKGPFSISGVWLDIDVDSGITTQIERFCIIDNDLII